MSELRIKNRSERDLRSCEVYQKTREREGKGAQKKTNGKQITERQREFKGK